MFPVGVNGPRLTLRELCVDDRDAVHAVYGDPLVTRHLSFSPRSREQVTAMIDRSLDAARQEPRSEYSLGVAVRDGRRGGHRPDDLVGIARLAREPQRAATVGFALRADQWGRGLGTETVHLLCALGFGLLGLHRIWAARAPLNTASQRTLLRAGMVAEGRIRDHVFVDGRWRDSLTHSVLEHEWNCPFGPSHGPR